MDCSPPAFLSMGFSRLEYWSGLPFPTAGDLPDPGMEPTSPELAGGFFTPPGKPQFAMSCTIFTDLEDVNISGGT